MAASVRVSCYRDWKQMQGRRMTSQSDCPSTTSAVPRDTVTSPSRSESSSEYGGKLGQRQQKGQFYSRDFPAEADSKYLGKISKCGDNVQWKRLKV